MKPIHNRIGIRGTLLTACQKCDGLLFLKISGSCRVRQIVKQFRSPRFACAAESILEARHKIRAAPIGHELQEIAST
jgi:hypothetical protein